MDLVSDFLDVEVKYDRHWRTTGNLFLEESYKGNPSGIRKGNFNLFVYGDYESAIAFKSHNLLTMVENGIDYKKTKGGD